jgi:hypothetical protein
MGRGRRRRIGIDRRRQRLQGFHQAGTGSRSDGSRFDRRSDLHRRNRLRRRLAERRLGRVLLDGRARRWTQRQNPLTHTIVVLSRWRPAHRLHRLRDNRLFDGLGLSDRLDWLDDGRRLGRHHFLRFGRRDRGGDWLDGLFGGSSRRRPARRWYHIDPSNHSCCLQIRRRHQCAWQTTRLRSHTLEQAQLTQPLGIHLDVIAVCGDAQVFVGQPRHFVEAALSVKFLGQQPLKVEQPQDPATLWVAHIKIEHTLRVLDGFTAQIGAESGRCRRHGLPFFLTLQLGQHQFRNGLERLEHSVPLDRNGLEVRNIVRV